VRDQLKTAQFAHLSTMSDKGSALFVATFRKDARLALIGIHVRPASPIITIFRVKIVINVSKNILIV
jgi:hypothetical protein